MSDLRGGRLLGGRLGGVRLRSGALVAAGAGVALVLASCSPNGQSSANHSSTTTTSNGGGRTTTTTTAVSPSTSTTTSAPTTTTTTIAGLATCQPGQLRFTVGQETGAAGTIAMTISMTNSSTVRCGLAGYPGMQLLDAQGGAIPTNVVRGQAQFPWPAANQAPAQVTLAPGASGTFALEYGDVPVGNETTCPSSAQAKVTPPNDFTAAVVALTIAPCDNGTVHVSPVYAS